ncbi:MAG TPA: OB-fold domain-containing protein [Dehalococcoidia bacterium]|nr:OB-fold domain-containing protein [Dehalococcoidia bacterium]
MAEPNRPTPVPDELTRPFWEAAAERRLVAQRCAACGFWQQPPAPVCQRCTSTDLAFQPVSGRGTVYTYTTMYQKNVAGFEQAVPYVNLVVELAEQPLLLMLSYLPGDAAGWVQIGAAVEVTFEPLPDGQLLPQWRRAPG